MSEDNSASLPLTPALGEAEFAAAVREALRHYHRPDRLRENPLLQSRLFAATASRADASSSVPTQTLKDMFREQFERLGDAPEIGTLKRALELTFFKPMRSQQAVADALNMSWSTYRRRLTDAVKVFTAQLWEAETALAETQAEHVAVAAEPASARRYSRRLPRLALGIVGLAILAVTVWLLLPTMSKHEAGTANASAVAANGKLTLAVLPFLNMNDDPAVQHLSDGLTEELINRLGRIAGLRVTARTSAFVFRDKTVDVRAAAHALGVENVLEGSVQKSGDTFRVRVALVNARDGYELWSDEYNVGSRDFLGVEDAIAKSVIEELHLERGAAALAGLQSRRGTANSNAHDFYLVGLEFLNRRTAADIEQAIAYFRRAIQADPNYAPAWSGVATAYAVLPDYDSDAPPDTHYAEAVAAAGKAITLDGRSAQAHAVLGELHEQHWEWRQAAREFQRALKLDPNDVTAHQWYAIYLWFVGDMQGALREMQTAHALDPLSPIVNADLGRALLYTGNTEGAIAQYRTAIALAPGFALAHLLLAEAYMAKGSYDAALQEMQTAVQLTPAPHPASYLSMLGLAYVLVGDRDKARAQLALLEARTGHHYVSGVSLALLYWALGEKDKTFLQLKRAAADHDHLMMPVVADREAAWTADPRYRALLAGIGLPIAGKP